MGITTIRLSKKLRDRLRKQEVHPRETSEQIVERILSKFEDKYKTGGKK